MRLSEKGVSCSDTSGISAVARMSRVLILACLPKDMQTVARSLRGSIRSSQIICSCLLGYSPQKLRSMLSAVCPILRLRFTGKAGELSVRGSDEASRLRIAAHALVMGQASEVSEIEKAFAALIDSTSSQMLQVTTQKQG